MEGGKHMRKAKIAFWLLLIGFVALVVLQNKTYFISMQQFDIDFGVTRYITPLISNGILLASVFVLGFLLTFIFSLPARFRLSREIKQLKATVQTHLDTISQLRSQLDGVQPSSGENEAAAAAEQNPPEAPPVVNQEKAEEQ
jgi:hypothetical protein